MSEANEFDAIVEPLRVGPLQARLRELFMRANDPDAGDVCCCGHERYLHDASAEACGAGADSCPCVKFTDGL